MVCPTAMEGVIFQWSAPSLISLRQAPSWSLGLDRGRIYGKRLPAHCFHIHTRRASRTALLSNPIRQWGRPGSYDPNLTCESKEGVSVGGANRLQVLADKEFRIIFKCCEPLCRRVQVVSSHYGNQGRGSEAFATESLGPARTADIRLEEIESSILNDRPVWLITLHRPSANAAAQRSKKPF